MAAGNCRNCAGNRSTMRRPGSSAACPATYCRSTAPTISPCSKPSPTPRACWPGRCGTWSEAPEDPRLCVPCRPGASRGHRAAEKWVPAFAGRHIQVSGGRLLVAAGEFDGAFTVFGVRLAVRDRFALGIVDRLALGAAPGAVLVAAGQCGAVMRPHRMNLAAFAAALLQGLLIGCRLRRLAPGGAFFAGILVIGDGTVPGGLLGGALPRCLAVLRREPGSEPDDYRRDYRSEPHNSTHVTDSPVPIRWGRV